MILMTAGFAALAVLRAMFLMTVAGESRAAAILQVVLLSAISAGLVACGSAIMAKTRPLTLAAARHARRAAAACRAARRQAEEKCSGTGLCCSGRCASGRSYRSLRLG